MTLKNQMGMIVTMAITAFSKRVRKLKSKTKTIYTVEIKVGRHSTKL